MLAALQPIILFRPPGWVLRAGGKVAALDIDFVNDRAFNAGKLASIASLLSCTRAATGYYTKADGTLVSFGNNALRYGTNGLLIEEARTNLLQQSQTLDNVYWANSGATVTGNATAAPNGTTTAAKLVEAVGGGVHIIDRGSVAIANATAYVISFYAKAAERSQVHCNTDITGSGARTIWDLSNGTIVQTGTGHTASISALANGWYRCMIAVTSGLTSTEIDFGIASAGSASYVGDGSSGIYMWGVQLEAGAFATSYIPTTSSSATRAADVVTLATSLIPLHLPSGSFLVKYRKSDLSAAHEVMGMTGLDAGAIFTIGYNPAAATSDHAYLRDLNANGLNNTTLAGTIDTVADHRIAAAYAANDVATCFDGGTMSTNGTFVPWTQSTAFTLGLGQGGAAYLDGYIKRLAYWSTRISNAALQALAP